MHGQQNKKIKPFRHLDIWTSRSTPWIGILLLVRYFTSYNMLFNLSSHHLCAARRVQYLLQSVHRVSLWRISAVAKEEFDLQEEILRKILSWKGGVFSGLWCLPALSVFLYTPQERATSITRSHVQSFHWRGLGSTCLQPHVLCNLESHIIYPLRPILPVSLQQVTTKKNYNISVLIWFFWGWGCWVGIS